MVEVTTGPMLVLVSWALVAVIVAAMGLLPATLTTVPGATSRRRLLSRALWWGVLVSTVAVLTASVLWPLGSIQAGGSVLLLASGMGAAGLLAARRRGLLGRLDITASAWWWAAAAAVALTVGYLAVAAVGPVTNYDTGLYHLGAIKYAYDFATLPGLANLFWPLGYGNATVPLAAILGNGPWGGEGYRLMNGALIMLLGVDALLRMGGRRRSPGDWFIGLSVSVVAIPMVALSDYWVTSPTSDSSLFVLTLVSMSFFLDAVLVRDRRWSSGGTAVAVCLVAVAMRPTMLPFVGLVTLIWLTLIWSGRQDDLPVGKRCRRATLAWLASLGVLMIAIQSIRDALLSGWVQYPLSLLPLPLEWRVTDPSELRAATLGNARDPADLWTASEGWVWIPGWVGRLWGQWETYYTALIVIASLALWLVARSRARVTPLSITPMLVAMVPPVTMVGIWFLVSPPAFRFIWGPLFSIPLVLAAWSLAALEGSDGRQRGLAHWSRVREGAWGWGSLLAVGGVVVFSAVTRLDVSTVTEPRTWTLGPLSIDYAVTPLPDVPVENFTMSTGLVVQRPVLSDQCWDNYPLCTNVSEDDVALRGPDIRMGFRRASS